MSKTGPPTSHEDDLLLVNAYLDGELDASAALAVERRLREDARLKADYERLSALRGVLAAKIAKDVASEQLRSKVAGISPSAGREGTSRKARVHTFGLGQMAASILVAGFVASGATVLALRTGAGDGDLGAVVAGHQRALITGQPVDVSSSDRHTVKPWLASKLGLSPIVPDLTTDGFPLVGGRVEIVGGRAVPALIYRRREHLISVVAVPKADAHDDGAKPGRESKDGYAVLTWQDAGFTYAAVSDVAREELEEFVDRWRTAARAS